VREFHADTVEGPASAPPASIADPPNLLAVPPLAPAPHSDNGNASPPDNHLADLPAPRMGDSQRLRQFQTQFEHGRNPYIAAAGPIVNLILVLNEGARHENPHALRLIAAGEVRAFYNQMAQQSVSPPNVQIASYALCSALDEAVLTTDWGSESDWQTETLLWMFHNDGTGGENVFKHLEELLLNPNMQLELMELLSLLLDLGFQGQHRIAPDGAHVLESLRVRLHEMLGAKRSKAPSPLRPPEPATTGSASRSHIGPIILALFVALVLLVVYLNLNSRTQVLTEPLLNRVEQLTESYEREPEEWEWSSY